MFGSVRPVGYESLSRSVPAAYRCGAEWSVLVHALIRFGRTPSYPEVVMHHLPAITVHCYLGHAWHRLCVTPQCACPCHKAKT